MTSAAVRPKNYALLSRAEQDAWFNARLAAEVQRKIPAFSDEALALRFAERHADSLRFVAAWNKWLRWDGARWSFDDTLHVFDLARTVCRAAAAESGKQKTAALVASAKTVAAVERLARASPPHHG